MSDTIVTSVTNYHEPVTENNKDTLVNIPKKSQVDYYKTDFLIGIPTTIVKFMVVDLQKGDQCFVELKKVTSERDALKQKNVSLSNTLDEYSSIMDLNENTIKNLNKTNAKYKKQSKFFKIVSGALLIGFLLKVPEL